MRKWFWLFIGFIGLAVALTIVMDRVSRARGRRSLEQLKAGHRAKGEKLTWAELGYPRPAETNEPFEAFLAAAARLGGGNPSRVADSARSYVAPGQARVGWAGDALVLASLGRKVTNTLSWAELEAELNASADVLAQIRRTIENPPARWLSNPTNFPLPRTDFLPRRNAAQWLAADCLAALHARELVRAREDLHALTALAQVHRDDLALVSQMIRTAIAGLAMPVVWEALQAPGWTEPDLAAMQQDWDELNLTKCVELGMLGERAYFEHAVTRLRQGGIRTLDEFYGSPTTGPKTAKGYLEEFVLFPVWRANSLADEMFYLQHCQRLLKVTRGLDQGTPWHAAKSEFGLLDDAMALETYGLRRYCHLATLLALPNIGRAAETVTRRETERRLTVVAIALRRYELRQGHWPASLSALVPEWLRAVPMDQMSGKPLVYRLNADGTFALYSVGEDGQDDGGDPHPAPPIAPDLWSGRDAVWPTAVFSNAPPAADALNP